MKLKANYFFSRGGVLRSYSADKFTATFSNSANSFGLGTLMETENQILNWTMEVNIEENFSKT